MSTNPAALQGWVKSTDPQSGNVFYANHVTRKTQWDAPADWVEPTVTAAPPAPALVEDDNEPLPSNWEVMKDPTTGKPFYVDHERKITQWTRPRVEPQTSSASLWSPAVASPPASGNGSMLRSNSSYLAQQHQYSGASSLVSQQSNSMRSYQQEAAYYSQPSNDTDVDLSDTMPPLEFKVATVADVLRPTCPNCRVTFTMSKRRHHCRLCGDVFCDACSNHRCTLPLPGPEFEKPVRICDFCFVDVDQGNFFSMRRYLTVLLLYTPGMEESGVATIPNVNAALSALQQDLDQMVSNGDQLEEKVSIPAATLVPEILKHVPSTETSDRAVRCMASLLSLESMAGKTEFAVAMYLYGKTVALSNLLDVLERSGSSRKTLFVQEQAARILFYLTESKLVAAVTRKSSELDVRNLGSVEEALDIPRAIRCMLDHASASGNPNLQRWSAATLKNLILEDQRRACLAVNEAAAMVASGENASQPAYVSHLPELVSTGGVMILGSLIGADDADTRAHAVSALSATLQSTRAVDAALEALSEMSGGEFGRTEQKDGEIVRAIVAAGGCAGSVAQLLLSAENTVAGMGCGFLSSLVKPLLADASASGSLTPQYEYHSDSSNHGACREAAIEIATGSCLPALLSLVREGKPSRAVELRWLAMETLAATVLAVCEMGRAWAAGQFEEGLERFGAPNKLKDAIIMLNEEGVLDCALQVLQSPSLGQSLGSSTSKETPAARIRECAGILLSSITSCSAEAIMELQTKNVLSALLIASTDSTMTMASTMRGDGAPRCVGVLETVATCLMFSWQHPSGSNKALLDSLIEMIDSGAIPYISKVMNTRVDWDSKDKVIGGMKGRIASGQFLCCLFGIALTDTTGIGMRRLMDAVDADSRSYRGGPQASQDARRTPSNILESTLSVLQTASNMARKSLMGGGGVNQQGMTYQSAVMDLVEASLLAAGSMCGSSIAPGGSEGAIIAGASFLESRTDPYVPRRKEICNVTCDIVVRGGRGEPTMLPTMMVGGFGEGSVLASLRLALAVAQNGTKEQHTKLAHCGILVPISDLLRSALSRGNIYKFTSALALVRFCGPYVAAGQGGGLEAVRDAIRVATNVLTLPVNPSATSKQMETQELLKSECIAALESLSHNASLWSSISTDALPSMIQYIHGAAASTGRGHATKCAALRAILQIVQVPSHAVSAAEAGIVGPMGQLLSSAVASDDASEVATLAMEILHAIASNQQARRVACFLEMGLVRSICACVGKAASEMPKQPADKRNDVTFLGLTILHLVSSDIEGDNSTQQLLQSSSATLFLDSIASEPHFVLAMCATMLLSTKMKLPRHDADSNDDAEFDIPKLYGSPLVYIPEQCAGFDNTHEATEALLFTTSVYACALDTAKSGVFWDTMMLRNQAESKDKMDCLRTSATLVTHFLALLMNDHQAFIPKNPRRQEEYLTVTRPLVRYSTLEALKNSMAELSGATIGPSADPYLTSLLVGFNVPRICLSMWKDPALLDLAFELLQEIMKQDPDEVLHLFVEGKDTIMSLFDLLNVDSGFEAATNVVEIRRFLASVLGQLGENGLLADAVARFEVRSSAIAALAAACLSEEERPPDDDDDMTSNRLSTVLMKCLVELCTVNNKDDGKSIRLASSEATAIAKSLGKKICHIVLSRFLERTKLKQYEMEEDESILTAPDVAMLCAVAQHEPALLVLRSIGGLHALSLVAAEGEVSALTALTKACTGDAEVLLEGDTYLSMMSLIGSDQHDASWRSNSQTWRQLEGSAFGLLSSLCNGSKKSRSAVAKAETCHRVVGRAVEIICALTNSSTSTEPLSETNVEQENNIETNVEADAPDDADDTSKVTPNDAEKGGTSPVFEIASDDAELGVAACKFLSSLTTVKVARDVLCSNFEAITSLTGLSTKGSHAALQLACVELMVSLAPYVSVEGALTPGEFAKLVPILNGEQASSTSVLDNSRLCERATRGVSVVFDSLPTEVQEDIAVGVTKLFVKNVNRCIITRSSTTDEERTATAQLLYTLTCTLLLFLGRGFVNRIFTKDVFVSLIHMIQWRTDPKTNIAAVDVRVWDAATANGVSLLSALLWRPDSTLVDVGVDLQSLSNTTLMLARPGKSPRKAIDVLSALSTIVDGIDAASSLAAKRIVDRLFN